MGSRETDQQNPVWNREGKQTNRRTKSGEPRGARSTATTSLTCAREPLLLPLPVREIRHHCLLAPRTRCRTAVSSPRAAAPLARPLLSRRARSACGAAVGAGRWPTTRGVPALPRLQRTAAVWPPNPKTVMLSRGPAAAARGRSRGCWHARTPADLRSLALQHAPPGESGEWRTAEKRGGGWGETVKGEWFLGLRCRGLQGSLFDYYYSVWL